MNNEIIEYSIEYEGYKLKVLNIGATITEYSLDGHNVVLSFSELSDYAHNPVSLGAVVGRTAGRIHNPLEAGWNIPLNYRGDSSLHGNHLQIRYYQVTAHTSNLIELTLFDEAGEFPGNATIKVRYQLGKKGLEQEIIADSDEPTLFNFTNHSYFNLNVGNTVLEHHLQLESSKVTCLDENMFVKDDVSVIDSVFDFRSEKKIGHAMNGNDLDQFKTTKFLDHPFKLDGKITYSTTEYALEIESTSDYVVIYAANYLGNLECGLNDSKCIDYGAICFETQKRPGNIDGVIDFYSKTTYTLIKK